MDKKQIAMMSLEEVNEILKDQGMTLRENEDDDKGRFGYVLCKLE